MGLAVPDTVRLAGKDSRNVAERHTADVVGAQGARWQTLRNYLGAHCGLPLAITIGW